MASIFDRYGLKEVSNVSVFALEADATNNIAAGDIVLYLDTLKVSTIEQTAEQTDAKGGWGNSKLISWDYGKEMTITLEDALLSPEFLRVMVGGAIRKSATGTSVTVNHSSAIIKLNEEMKVPANFVDSYGNTVATVPATYKYINLTKGTRGSGTSSAAITGASAADEVRIFWTEAITTADTALEITISPSTFPGTYKFVGDTLIRSEATGKDERYQWIVPKGKVSSEVTFTMEAEGDPATFNMSVNVLRGTNDNGEYEMMKFIKYNV